MDEWLDDQEQKVWRQWLELNTRIPGRLNQELSADSGLSLQDYEVMVVLSESDSGGLRITAVATALNWERSRLSHHLSRMEKRGLVERRECLEDARGFLVALTPTGQESLVRAAPGHVAAVRRHFFDALEPGDVEVLDRITTRMLEGLSAGDSGPDGGAVSEGGATQALRD